MQSLSFHTAASMSKRSCVQLHSNGTVSCRVACSLQVRAAFASIWKRIWLITGCVLRCPTSRQSVTSRQSLGGWARITSHQQLATDRPPLARSPSLSHSSAPSLSLPLLLSLPLSLLHVWKLRATWKLHCQLLYTIYSAACTWSCLQCPSRRSRALPYRGCLVQYAKAASFNMQRFLRGSSSLYTETAHSVTSTL